MRQIADWLEKLGLGQYARRFNENGVDLSVLPDLTDQDLEKLGVLLGHRVSATSQNPPDSRIRFSMIHGWSAFGGPTMVDMRSTTRRCRRREIVRLLSLHNMPRLW